MNRQMWQIPLKWHPRVFRWLFPKLLPYIFKHIIVIQINCENSDVNKLVKVKKVARDINQPLKSPCYHLSRSFAPPTWIFVSSESKNTGKCWHGKCCGLRTCCYVRWEDMNVPNFLWFVYNVCHAQFCIWWWRIISH